MQCDIHSIYTVLGILGNPDVIVNILEEVHKSMQIVFLVYKRLEHDGGAKWDPQEILESIPGDAWNLFTEHGCRCWSENSNTYVDS